MEARVELVRTGDWTRTSCTHERTCVGAANTLTNWASQTDRGGSGYPIDVVYLDFQKSFDKVPHKRLMFKIKSSWIIGEIYNWNEDWLKERGIVGSYKWKKVKVGCPRDLYLSSTVSNYNNDIDNWSVIIYWNLLMIRRFKVFVSDMNEINKLQLDLHYLCKWSQNWLMLFIVDKSKVMHIGFNNIKAKYELNGKFREKLSEERDLEVIIRSDLKCSSQCIKAVNTANSVRVLVWLKENLWLGTRRSLYNSINHWLGLI